ncbi:MAG: cadherin repeat domain-containing protein [Burkholderiales bacterium]|nr:cadherin repeat domain-containing protein [Burkholderiales bacterium]
MSVNANTGAVSLTAAADYATKSFYLVDLRATDNGSPPSYSDLWLWVGVKTTSSAPSKAAGVTFNAQSTATKTIAPSLDSVWHQGNADQAQTLLAVHDDAAKPGELSLKLANNAHQLSADAGSNTVGTQGFYVVGGNGQTLAQASISDKAGAVTNLSAFAPLVLDLDGKGIHLSAASVSRSTMDVNDDGVRDFTGWVAKGNGLLAFDGSNNGKVDNIAELSFQAYSKGGNSSLEGFATVFDSNHDGVFDAKDALWKQVGVWSDNNQNGQNDAGEFSSLDAIGISAIKLKGVAQNSSSNGNAILSTTNVVWKDGHTTVAAEADLGFVSGTATGASVVALHGTTAVDTFTIKPMLAGATTIDQFSSTGNDHLVFSHRFNDLQFTSANDVLAHAHQENGNTIIDLGLGQTLTLTGVVKLDVSAISLVG